MEHTGWIWQGAEGAWPLVAGVLGALALAATFFSYRRAAGPPARRLPAWLCKGAVFALLLMFLLEPTVVTQTPKPGENNVVVLVDNSASLALKDPAAPGPAVPPELPWMASGQGAEPPGWMKRLMSVFRVQVDSFDDRLHENVDMASLDFSGIRSAMVTSVESLLQRHERQPMAAVLLFTDGNATDPENLEALLSRKAVAPIFPVLLGLSAPPRDLALQTVEVTQSPFEDSPVAVTARVSAHGLDGEELVLLIQDETGKTVHTEQHRLLPGEATHTFQARFRPAKMGLSFFSVWILRASAVKNLGMMAKLTEASGEATLENNRRVLAIDRRSGPYRVLYLSGRPNWEYKFMRRALEQDPEVSMVSLIRMARREPKFQWRGREGEMTNPLFRGFKGEGTDEAQRYDQPVIIRLGISDPGELADGFPKTAEEFFGSYRAVVLDDIEAAFFTQEQMDLLERFVSVRGGSLLMLGGQECFRLGGYEHTPVGRMLPVYLDAAGAAPAVENASFNLTREGWLEPWMRLRQTEGDDESRLAGMPTFFSVNQTTAIKPGASVLATVTDENRKTHPAWVVQRYGSGRVAAVTLGDMWRWGMHDPESRKDLEKSWRQLFRWLVVDVPDRVEVQATVTPGGSYELVNPQVRVRDKAFRPQDDASVRLELVQPDGATLSLPAEPTVQEAGLFESSTHAGLAGGYRLKAVVQDGAGATIGESATGWALNPGAEEFASLVPNRALLEKLAQWSGGRVLLAEDLDRWARDLPRAALPMMETRVEPWWNQWWVLLVLAALLSTEWWMRRRQGWR